METITKDGKEIAKIAADKDEAFLENIIKATEDRIKQSVLSLELDNVVLAHLKTKRKT